VGSRFDDLIYWTSLLQLRLIIAAHTLNSFLITNLSLYFFWFSDWSLVSIFYYSVRLSASRVESYITTDGPSASLSWNKAPVWGLRPDIYFYQTVAGLLISGALSDERTGLLFKIVAGPQQRSHSRVRVHWDSRTYFTVSDSRLLFSSPPTTRKTTVEVFDHASTRDDND
jgi:hypothetical protein